MYSKHHAPVSFAIAAVFLLAHPDPTATGLPTPALVGYAVAVGVCIDLDHFLIERVLHGEWGAVRRAIEEPGRLVLDQADLFVDGTMSPLDRLLSHVVIVGIAVPVTWFVTPTLGLVTALVLYGHVLSDVAWDVYLQRVVDGPPHADDIHRDG